MHFCVFAAFFFFSFGYLRSKCSRTMDADGGGPQSNGGGGEFDIKVIHFKKKKKKIRINFFSKYSQN